MTAKSPAGNLKKIEYNLAQLENKRFSAEDCQKLEKLISEAEEWLELKRRFVEWKELKSASK